MFLRPSLIWPSKRESTAGLFVDWRMALAPLRRFISRASFSRISLTGSLLLDDILAVFEGYRRRECRRGYLVDGRVVPREGRRRAEGIDAQRGRWSRATVKSAALHDALEEQYAGSGVLLG